RERHDRKPTARREHSTPRAAETPAVREGAAGGGQAHRRVLGPDRHGDDHREPDDDPRPASATRVREVTRGKKASGAEAGGEVGVHPRYGSSAQLGKGCDGLADIPKLRPSELVARDTRESPGG